MKKLLIIFFYATVSAFAQPKVYRADEFEAKVMPPRLQNSEYPNLSKVSDDGRNNGVMKYDLELRKLNYDFRNYALSKKVDLSAFEKKYAMPINLLFKEQGKLEYIVFGFNRMVVNKQVFFDTLNAKEDKEFRELIGNYFQNADFSNLKNTQKCSIYTSVALGKELRKSRKNMISTIAMAETCNQPDTVKSLVLNKLNLEKFPDVVFRFKNLEKLDLSDNYIEQIPKQIWELKKLKQLSLSGNYIDYSTFKFKKNKHLKDLNLQFTGMTKMPKSIKKNRVLEIFFVGNNKIEFRKNDFRRMSNLKALNLYNVRTETLPKSIGKLKNLEELDLYHNELKFLPKEVCQLSKLKTLAVANNQLWNLPEEITKLTNLQTLYAHHNRLNTLPVLPNLKLLDIGYNLFKVFPEEVYQLKDLEEFDITHNEIMDIPEGLVALNKLQKVFIRGNEFYKTDKPDEKLTKLTDSLEKRQVMVR